MGRTEFPDLQRLRASLGWYGRTFNESEMARSSECMGFSALKKFLTGTTLSETGMLRQQSVEDWPETVHFPAVSRLAVTYDVGPTSLGDLRKTRTTRWHRAS